ncbi:hypothetical protein ECIG_05017 [Escherichia coli M605]|uniref:Uncharacterized protein n=1 Tax=Escherichia coli M605 TaxID=656417 RepID=F4T648_ECOLX|nr:hypothetical protein ECIG_05017 [Escherichia coli M605]
MIKIDYLFIQKMNWKIRRAFSILPLAQVICKAVMLYRVDY